MNERCFNSRFNKGLLKNGYKNISVTVLQGALPELLIPIDSNLYSKYVVIDRKIKLIL